LRVGMPGHLDAGLATTPHHLDEMIQQRERLLAQIGAAGPRRGCAPWSKGVEGRLTLIDLQRRRRRGDPDRHVAELESAHQRACELGF